LHLHLRLQEQSSQQHLQLEEHLHPVPRELQHIAMLFVLIFSLQPFLDWFAYFPADIT
jgi:hypothetical protein